MSQHSKGFGQCASSLTVGEKAASTPSQAKSMLHKPDIPSRIAMTIICLMVIIVVSAVA